MHNVKRHICILIMYMYIGLESEYLRNRPFISDFDRWMDYKLWKQIF